jgi:predicted PurR-regulated permease PerM
MLAETGGNIGRLIKIDLPGYDLDLKRLGSELGFIWNAFLRGQLILVSIWIIVFSILLSALGMHYALGLALLAGLANKFIPYVGAWITWTTYILVALFQGSTIFGLSPWGYVALVVGLSIVIDSSMDSLISPRIMARALKVNPAAVMVAALIGLNFLGLIGVMLAAPVLATLKLFSEYVMNKMLDRNPWTHIDTISSRPPRSMPVFLNQTWQIVVIRFRKSPHRVDQPPDTREK